MTSSPTIDSASATAEKLVKLGLTREKGWLYYIDKHGDVARTRAPRLTGQAGTAEVLAKTGITRDNAFMYFLDKDGDLARTPRKVGGTKKSEKV